ncbi:MAG: zinc ribbon domain-containing protein [Promethearchaeota archaeon]|nr:MAG: zinc ribbon domain-containing protein [Candidatus Lokiarchaeota archaeon]
MKYKRNQYSEGVSICSFIIAGILIYWGINDIFVPMWVGTWLNWWGLVWFGIAAAIIIGQIAALANRSKLRNAVLYEYEAHPEATIEQIRQNTGITIRDVQAIVLDLKANGLLRGKFSSTTGQMTHADIIKKPQEEVSEGKVVYCPNCGTAKVKESAVFCSYCGTKL